MPPKWILASTTRGSWKESTRHFDVMTHAELPARLVEDARAEEVQEFNTLPVWDIVKTQECWDITGRPPISTKWVDVNEHYAPTPPLEAKRLLFSEAATCRKTGRGERKLLFVDARKAYLNAKVDRPTYVELPAEVGRPGYCGRLNRCMHGSRRAATRWEETYTQALERLGFT